MACISPPELDEVRISMFLDGEADGQVARHLEQCPHCHEKAERLKRAQNALKAQLFRVACPSPEDLRDYHLGRLPQARAAEVSRHLVRCPHCSRERAMLEDYLGERPGHREGE